MRRLAALCSVPILLLAACGDDGDDGDGGDDEAAGPCLNEAVDFDVESAGDDGGDGESGDDESGEGEESDDGSDDAGDGESGEGEGQDITPAEDDDLLDAVTVCGEHGEEAEVEVDGSVETEETVRRVLVAGDGPVITEDARVDVHLVMVNGETGEELQNSYAQQTPMQLADVMSVPGVVEGIWGVPLGSRVVVAMTLEDPNNPTPEGEAPSTVVLVADLLEREPLAAAEDDPLLDAVSVSGEFGELPEVEVDGPVEATETVRRVVSEGDGPPVEIGTNLAVDAYILDAEGQEQQETYSDRPAPMTPFEEGSIPPFLISGLLDVPLGSRVVVAAGSEDVPPNTPEGEATTTLYVLDLYPQEEVAVDAELGDDLPGVTLYNFGVPDVEMPEGDPPEDLVVEVLVEGDGEEVPEDANLEVQYSGFLWADGSEFDSSWTNGGAPATFGLGEVIEGWGEGLAGQKVGSTVLLVVPPGKGYGSEGSPPSIPGDATLVFVTEIISVVEDAEAPGG